jgi:hypothetical protein
MTIQKFKSFVIQTHLNILFKVFCWGLIGLIGSNSWRKGKMMPDNNLITSNQVIRIADLAQVVAKDVTLNALNKKV